MEQATHIIAMEFLWNFMAFLMNITFVFYNKSYSKKTANKANANSLGFC